MESIQTANALQHERRKPPIAAIGLSKSFCPRANEAVPVLRDVNFTAHWGQMTAIVGPSGSGKSTLMYCLAGLETASSGSVEILGQKVTRLSRAQSARFRRDNLGFVFQAYNLVPSMTVEDNLRLPFTLRRVQYPAKRAAALLQRLGVARLRRQQVTRLSGGEQQRVALTRVLIADPPIVFADEPTGALDSESGGRVVDELRAFADRPDHAVVMVTHSAEVAQRCDRIVRMNDGMLLDAAPSFDNLPGEPVPASATAAAKRMYANTYGDTNTYSNDHEESPNEKMAR